MATMEKNAYHIISYMATMEKMLNIQSEIWGLRFFSF